MPEKRNRAIREFETHQLNYELAQRWCAGGPPETHLTVFVFYKVDMLRTLHILHNNCKLKRNNQLVCVP